MTVDAFTTPGPQQARRAPLAHRAGDLAAAGGPGLSLREVSFETVLNVRSGTASAVTGGKVSGATGGEAGRATGGEAGRATGGEAGRATGGEAGRATGGELSPGLPGAGLVAPLPGLHGTAHALWLGPDEWLIVGKSWAVSEWAAARPTVPNATAPEPTEPKPTEPKPTEPKPTEPKPAVPELIVPEPAAPKPTVPEPTVPEPTVAAKPLSAVAVSLSVPQNGLHLVDLSANYATLLITGPHARDLLEKAITLDLHPRSFAPGQCALTTFARAGVLLWQVGEQAYRLMFRPSFGTYLTDWLIDASQEFRQNG
ncbi:hypothetical protein KIH74_00495 [Kineosporia sp. J2-2]|uniref:Sarcosine oxidase subunit gamma n=1 Tax=Kineosporia corallincola TaxID=2835133 RepID=A0ABS5T970_9ACTN|nr:sarcosine oxidase subunit gamma family protein [Kineosporia corallincola]MBT0767378.1 hypothetical protein [Kineosporia corallincola]